MLRFVQTYLSSTILKYAPLSVSLCNFVNDFNYYKVFATYRALPRIFTSANATFEEFYFRTATQLRCFLLFVAAFEF